MDIEHGFFDQEQVDHLMNVDDIADPMHQLEELQGVMQQLSGKAGRRMEKVKNHMNQCGTCLSKMMKAGQLVPIEHYWAMGQMMGQGRLPKIHRQVN